MTHAVVTWMWLGWLGAFGALEGWAIVTKRWDDTLSAHVWKWFSVTGTGHLWRARRFALLAFLAWLCAHFLTGGKF
jgi:hypothetical protein